MTALLAFAYALALLGVRTARSQYWRSPGLLDIRVAAVPLDPLNVAIIRSPTQTGGRVLHVFGISGATRQCSTR